MNLWMFRLTPPRPGAPGGPGGPSGPGIPGIPSLPGGPGGPCQPKIEICDYFRFKKKKHSSRFLELEDKPSDIQYFNGLNLVK